MTPATFQVQATVLREISSVLVRGWSRVLNAFGRDTVAILFARLLQNANGFLQSIIIVHKFGLVAAGTMTIAAIPTVVFSTLCTFGLPYVFARETVSIEVRNSIGLWALLIGIIISAPIVWSIAAIEAGTASEVWSILFLGMAGSFFAQTTVANALLVLQNKTNEIVFSPLGNAVGLIIGLVVCHDLASFALIVMVTRFIGVMVIFLRLPRAPVSVSEVRATMTRGLRVVVSDLLNTLGDQGPIIVISNLISRSDLGVFGLCRQILTVCDTPGWTRAITLYPEICRDPIVSIPKAVKQMFAIGIVTTIFGVFGCIILGVFVYHVPKIALLGPIFVAATPFRYLVVICDFSMRGIDAIRASTKMILVRCIIAFLLIPFGALIDGLVGSMIATFCYSAAVAALACLGLWSTFHRLPSPSAITDS